MITRTLADYHTSRDYAELWRRAQSESLACVVDWHECRDIAHTIVTSIDDPELLALEVSGRGICYLRANSPEELAREAERVKLEWIVPEKNPLTGKESGDRLRRRRRHGDPAGTDGRAREQVTSLVAIAAELARGTGLPSPYLEDWGLAALASEPEWGDFATEQGHEPLAWSLFDEESGMWIYDEHGARTFDEGKARIYRDRGEAEKLAKYQGYAIVPAPPPALARGNDQVTHRAFLEEDVMAFYRNHRGERRERSLVPMGVRWGVTEWHPEPGILVRCKDLERAGEELEFSADGFEAAADAVIRVAIRNASTEIYEPFLSMSTKAAKLAEFPAYGRRGDHKLLEEIAKALRFAGSHRDVKNLQALRMGLATIKRRLTAKEGEPGHGRDPIPPLARCIEVASELGGKQDETVGDVRSRPLCQCSGKIERMESCPRHHWRCYDPEEITAAAPTHAAKIRRAAALAEDAARSGDAAGLYAAADLVEILAKMVPPCAAEGPAEEQAGEPRPVYMASRAKFCGQDATLICDGLCSKAWGINSRPGIRLPDEIVWLADGELPDAPADPGTYEEHDAKPQSHDEAHNRWCWRECERSSKSFPGSPLVKLRCDWSTRTYDAKPLGQDEIAAEKALEKASEESSAGERSIGEQLRRIRRAADFTNYLEDETAAGLDFDEWLTRQEDARRRRSTP